MGQRRVMMPHTDEILTVSEAADLLDVSEAYVRRLAREQRVPAFKLGKAWRFSRRQIIEWIEENAMPESLIETALVEEAERRVGEAEGTAPLEDVKTRLGL